MAKTTPYPFQDHTLALDQRVEDLVSRLTAEEKIEAMLQYQPAVERLGVKAYKHGTEAAHGIAWLGEATYFPQPVGLACTWDAELMQRIGNVISDEARVMYKRNPEVHGLTLWAPTVDMERDPRWGRNEEAYGEDPYLTGELTSKLVQGIQGDHPVYKKAVATLKHFLGNNNEVDRGSGSSSIDPRNMREYYLKAFERPFVEGQAKSMMTAYNSINGTPALMHPLVHEVVKNEWKMDGFIVSDAGDVMGIMRDHGYYDSHTPGVAASIKAGIDSITDDADLSKAAVREALEQGLLDWNDIDTALHNTFRVRFMLGEFDPEELNPYAAIGEESMLTETARATAAEATRKSVVLLKNDDHRLPLSATSTGSVAIIGELGGVVYRDWYSGTLPYAVTAVEAIRNKVAGDVHYTDGNDRIRLRTANGELLHVRVDGNVGTQTDKGTTGSNQDAGASEPAIASHSSTADCFILSDWGYDSYCLRSEATGTYLAADDEQQRLATATEEVYGWFAKEVLRLIEQPDGHIGIRTWNGRELYWDQTEGTVRIAEGEHRYPPVQAEWQIPAAARAALGDVEATVSVEEIAPSSIIPEPASAQAIGSTEAFHFSKEVLENGIERAVQLATEAETAIVFVGNHPLINGKEEVDRPGLELAASQLRMVQQVYAANPNTVVVVVGSYPFTMDWIQQHIPAIVYITHAGPELGNAIADVLYGDYAPAGRLNMTWYRSAEQLGNLLDYDIIRSGRTYQYFEGDVLYPFGHGLTYSPISYSELKLSANTLQADAMLTVQVTIQNEGGLDSDEVVQLYTRSRQSRVKQPLKTLRAFQRVHIQAGQSIQVQLQLPLQELAFWDVTRSKYVVETGAYDVLIGRSSSDIRLEQSIQIEGETIPPRDPYQTIRAENYDNYQAIHLIEANDSGAATEAINDNAWLLYTDMNFNSSVSSLTARLSSQTNTPEIKVYIDNIDAEPIATLSVPIAEQATSTTSAANSTTEDWQEVTADIKNPSLHGIHAVYLVPAKGTGISEFRFNPAKL